VNKKQFNHFELFPGQNKPHCVTPFLKDSSKKLPLFNSRKVPLLQERTETQIPIWEIVIASVTKPCPEQSEGTHKIATPVCLRASVP
jgi:hypothetical protein